MHVGDGVELGVRCAQVLVAHRVVGQRLGARMEVVCLGECEGDQNNIENRDLILKRCSFSKELEETMLPCVSLPISRVLELSVERVEGSEWASSVVEAVIRCWAFAWHPLPLR